MISSTTWNKEVRLFLNPLFWLITNTIMASCATPITLNNSFLCFVCLQANSVNLVCLVTNIWSSLIHSWRQLLDSTVKTAAKQNSMNYSIFTRTAIDTQRFSWEFFSPFHQNSSRNMRAIYSWSYPHTTLIINIKCTLHSFLSYPGESNRQMQMHQ